MIRLGVIGHRVSVDAGLGGVVRSLGEIAPRLGIELFVEQDLLEEGAHGALLEYPAELDALLTAQAFVTGREYGLADIAFVPWLLRLPRVAGVELASWPAVAGWLERLLERPAVAAESDVVATL